MARRAISVLCVLGLAACGEEPPAEPVPIEDVRIAEAPPPAPEPADLEGPAWPEDAALHADASGQLDATPRSVRVTWPEATDDVGVVAYVVRLDGEEAARVDAPATQTDLADVAFEAARAFAVVAVDAAGNESPAIETRDALSPWLAEGAEIVGSLDGAMATLTWPAARDDGEVAAYLVMRGPDEVARLRPDVRRYRYRRVEGEPGVAIWAEDAAGHKRLIGDGARIEVLDAQRRVEAMLLGALGSNNGALSDVLAAGAYEPSLDRWDSAEGVGVATTGGTLRERGGGGRVGAADIGGLGGLSRGSAAPPAEPAPPAQHIRGRVTIGALEDESGSGLFDPAIVTRQLRARLRAIQACYERELRNTPTLAGRVLVELTIEPSGSVSRAEAVENGTGSPAVASCVTNTVRRFRFNPGPEGGSVTYRYPLTFAPEP